MKCALVTGGSRGIGSAICKKLAESKEYHILINYQSNVEAAEKTLEVVKENGSTGQTGHTGNTTFTYMSIGRSRISELKKYFNSIFKRYLLTGYESHFNFKILATKIVA